MPALVFVFDWEGEKQQQQRRGGGEDGQLFSQPALASTSQLSPRDQFLGHSSLKASRSQSVCVLSTLCCTTHATNMSGDRKRKEFEVDVNQQTNPPP